MFLDKESKNLLDKIIAINEIHPEYEGMIPTEDIESACKSIHIDEVDIPRILDGMRDKKLLKYEALPQYEPYEVFLTQDGKTYKEINKLKQCAKWKERFGGFIIGAVVASIPWALNFFFG